MRLSDDLNRVPVVIMSSAAATGEHAAQLKDLGVERYIKKPADLEASLQIGFVLKEILLKRVG